MKAILVTGIEKTFRQQLEQRLDGFVKPEIHFSTATVGTSRGMHVEYSALIVETEPLELR